MPDEEQKRNKPARMLVMALGSSYMFMIPLLIFFQGEAAAWDWVLFFLCYNLIWMSAYQAFAGLFYQRSPRRFTIPIQQSILIAAWFAILYYSNMSIKWSGGIFNHIGYGYVGVIIGLLIAIVRKPDQDEINEVDNPYEDNKE